MKYPFAVLWLAAALGGAPAEYPAVMAEPNLEKRSELALAEAETAITAAKQAYDQQKADEFRTRLVDVEQLAELSYKSLQDTGKRARRSPKYFKRAELRLRTIMRRLTGLGGEVSVDDRPLVESALARVNGVHEQLLHDIMTKK